MVHTTWRRNVLKFGYYKNRIKIKDDLSTNSEEISGKIFYLSKKDVT
jgi:hypothetical protein